MTTRKLRAILLTISGALFATHLVGEIGIYAFDGEKTGCFDSTWTVNPTYRLYFPAA